MPREEKVQAVEELTRLLARSSLAVVTDYRGLTVSDMATLRRRLREQNVELRVAKNTLLRFAAEKSGQPALKEILVGTTAVAFTEGDIAAVAKVLGDYERTSRVFKVKGGILGGRLIQASEVASLATLPSREVLLSRVLAGFQAPVAGLVGVLGGLIGGLTGTLEARRQQLEQGAA